MSVRRRLSSLVLALGMFGISGGAVALVTNLHASSTHHVAGCSTCPRPPEQPY